jgi:hypothetical protein
MTILQLIENTGNFYKKTASTLGGEYSGPCPWCHGTDRFSIHPAKNHYVCRKCKRAGDSIKFLRDYYNKTYFEACKELSIQPKIKYNSLNTATEQVGQNKLVETIWSPRKIELPALTWQTKAESILFEAYKYLLSSAGKQHRNWLNARGISNNTIKAARMGWNNQSLTFNLESWGLTPQKDQNGKNRQIWIPEGLLIPQFQNQKIIRLRVRQANPITNNRFIIIPGSATGYFNYSVHLNIKSTDTDTDTEKAVKPVLITESELDGWLLQQELKDSFQIYAVGNASARPDQQTHIILQDNKILLNLDDDPAGHNETTWWQEHYPQTVTWFSEFGKDPGESFEVGCDIRKWGEQGLEQLKKIKMENIQEKPPKDISLQQLKNNSFKNKVLEKFDQQKKKNKIIKKTEKIILKKPSTSFASISKALITDNFICIHGLFCNSLRNNICLINNQSPYEMDRCPKNQWYRYHDSDTVFSIVLTPGVKKNNHKCY